MTIEGDNVTIPNVSYLELLGVSPKLELDKEYNVYEGKEFIGTFTRREPHINEDKQLVMGGDFKPVQPMEYVSIKFNIEE